MNAQVTFTVTRRGAGPDAQQRQQLLPRLSLGAGADGQQPASHLPPVTGTPKGSPTQEMSLQIRSPTETRRRGKPQKLAGGGLPSAGGTALLLQRRPHTQTTFGSSVRERVPAGKVQVPGRRVPPVSDPGTNAPPGRQAPPSHVSLAGSPLTARSRTRSTAKCFFTDQLGGRGRGGGGCFRAELIREQDPTRGQEPRKMRNSLKARTGRWGDGRSTSVHLPAGPPSTPTLPLPDPATCLPT